jgi:hypothetical protein
MCDDLFQNLEKEEATTYFETLDAITDRRLHPKDPGKAATEEHAIKTYRLLRAEFEQEWDEKDKREAEESKHA